MSSHPLTLTPILLLSSHVLLGVASGTFPSGFATKTLLSVCCPTQDKGLALLISLDVIILLTFDEK
jgi:hypothetical protein